MKTIEQLQAEVNALIVSVKTEFQPLSESALNHKQAPDSWSILECVEHLNRYAVYYLAALDKAIQKAAHSSAPSSYKLTWFGKMSINLVDPSNVKKNKTVRHMNPSGSQLSAQVLTTFIAHQQQLLDLLKAAQQVDVNKKLIPVEFFRLIRMNIIETLIFTVTHQNRHIQQALRVKAGLSAENQPYTNAKTH